MFSIHWPSFRPAFLAGCALLVGALLVGAQCGCRSAGGIYDGQFEGGPPMGDGPERRVFAAPIVTRGSRYLAKGPTLPGELLTPQVPPTTLENELRLQALVVELTKKNDAALQQISGLQDELDRSRDSFAAVESELERTRRDLASARKWMQQWPTELDILKIRLEAREQNQLQAIDELTSFVNQVIQEQSSVNREKQN